MAKLTLKPDATFRHTVYIPVPGGDPAAVEFVFKQRGRKAMAAFTEKHKEAWTADTVLDCAEGWDLAESFTRENVELWTAISTKYLTPVRETDGRRTGTLRKAA